MTETVVLLANPENRRATLFQAALARAGRSPATVVAWEDWLAGRVAWEEYLQPGVLLRIESPGENFAVEKLLLQRGAELAEVEGSPFLARADVERVVEDRGLILHPRQWYLGFRRALGEIDAAVRAAQARTMNSPAAIATMFDKGRCHTIFQTAGVPVPEGFVEPADFAPGDANSSRSGAPRLTGYDELTAWMKARDWKRVFVKLAHGSSASGVVAYQRGERECAATTSAELVREDGRVKLYNSLRVRRYTDEREIAAVIDALCRERVHVERWLPKASLAQGPFDLRVVVIGGRARQVVVRHGRSPMTNLHLGNARGEVAEFFQAAGDEVWRRVRETCLRAAKAIQRNAATSDILTEAVEVPRDTEERRPSVIEAAPYAGVDVCLTPGFRAHAVLEINAFGDLLPGVLDAGQDTYAAEIDAIPLG